jgi:hypothetical protein
MNPNFVEVSDTLVINLNNICRIDYSTIYFTDCTKTELGSEGLKKVKDGIRILLKQKQVEQL